MASIRRTPGKKWKAVIRKKGWPTESKNFRTRLDAQDWARRVEDEMVRGVYIDRAPSERLTFSAAMERYLKEETPKKKDSTQRAERNRGRELIARFGRFSLAALNRNAMAKYRNERLASGRKPNTVLNELALLSHLFTVAIREWGLGLFENPVKAIKKPSPGPGRERRLSGDEEVRLRAEIAGHSNPMLGWIYEIAIETAMRKSEIIRLEMNHVDLKRRLARVINTKNGDTRTVPLSHKAVAIFAEALANPMRPKGCKLIFFGEPGRDGVRKPYEFNKIWRQKRDKVQIADLHFQDLRHEGVSRLVESGFSDQEVSAISGHKTMQMLKRYSHLRTENLIEKLDRIPRKEVPKDDRLEAG